MTRMSAFCISTRWHLFQQQQHSKYLFCILLNSKEYSASQKKKELQQTTCSSLSSATERSYLAALPHKVTEVALN